MGAFDIGSKLTGGVGYEYEKEETRVAVDISHNCVSCKVYGGIGAILDGKPSTKLILQAISDDDIGAIDIEMHVDVRYNTRKTHLNHLSITSGDIESFNPSYIKIMARDEVEDPWKYIHQENWARNEVKKQIMFNNLNSYFEYRLQFRKKRSAEKLEISDCNIINMITSSLAAVTYYKITNTMLFSPSTVQPKRGFMIGMINYPSKNFIVSVNISLLGKTDYDFSNIYSFKDDPTSAEMQLGLQLNEKEYKIYGWVADEYAFSQNSLAENVAYTVTTKVLGDYMTLYVDGTVVATTEVKYADRADFTKLYAFVSEYGEGPANVVVKGLRFINLKND